jgi:hypothetical protein
MILYFLYILNLYLQEILYSHSLVLLTRQHQKMHFLILFPQFHKIQSSLTTNNQILRNFISSRIDMILPVITRLNPSINTLPIVHHLFERGHYPNPIPLTFILKYIVKYRLSHTVIIVFVDLIEHSIDHILNGLPVYILELMRY